jgi:tetratricopeptide (TPR) repeat protein
MAQAIDWSWGLLHAPEQETLAQISVFRGGFDADAAQAVVRIEGADVASTLAALAARSLLCASAPGRYALYESVRAFASHALRLSGALAAVEARHAEYFFGKALRISIGADRIVPADAAERENLGALLAYGVAASRSEMALRAAIALDALSGESGLGRAAMGLLEAALASAGPGSDIGLVGRALGVRAASLRRLGRMADAARDARTALALAETSGDRRRAATLRRGLGEALFGLGDHAGALAQFERALEAERALGNQAAEALVLQHLGAVHQSLGHADEAGHHYREALALSLLLDDPQAEVRASMGIGSYWLEREDREAARLAYAQALEIARREGMDRSERVVEGYLGLCAFDEGALDRAGEHLERAVWAARAAGDVQVEGVFGAVLGAVRAAEDRIDDAQVHFDQAHALLSQNPFFRAVASLHHAHLDLALARRSRAASEDLEADHRLRFVRIRLDAARLRIPAGAPSLADRSDDARIAIRILERALSAA